MSRRRPRSLRFRIAASALLAYAALLALLTAATYFTFRSQVRSAMSSTEKILLASLDWAVAPLLESGDLRSVRRLLENFAADRLVESVNLTAPDGTVLAEGGAASGAVGKMDLADLFARRKLIAYEEREGFLSAAIPVRGAAYSRNRSSDVAAVLVMTMDVDRYLARYTPLVHASIGISVAAILAMGGTLLLLVGRWLIAPLGAFTQAAARLQGGDYSVRVDVSDPAEFADFGAVFNRMVQEVAIKETELNRRVEERTQALKAAMESLEATQDALVRQEKLASIGRLAAGIAHEINNPTAFIRSNLVTLAREAAVLRSILRDARELSLRAAEAESGEIRTAAETFASRWEEEDVGGILLDLGPLAEESLSGTARIRSIVQGLKVYARDEGESMVPCDMNEIVRSALKVASAKIVGHSEVVADFGELPPVLAVPGRIEQVIVNLVVNADDAIQGSGTIRIATRAETDRVAVVVSDDGVGMEPETLGRIFEPFFTTKDVGKGTGLGLSVSLGIVEKHGGTIEVASRPGEGSTFIVRLPAAASGEGA